MTRKVRTYSSDSNEYFGSRSNSFDDNFDRKSKPIKIIKRRKRDDSYIQMNITPPNKTEFYKNFLLIFKNTNN